MRCTLELFATLREKYSAKKVEVEFSGSIHDFFISASKKLGRELLEDVYSDLKNRVFRDDRMITINGRNIKDIKGIPELKDGDNIALFPPIAGGLGF